MNTMDAFEAYRCYLALKLHFTTDSYNIVQQKGRVKASRDSFMKRRDLYAISKMAKTFSDEEIINFLVSNFVSGNRWGGVFDADAKQTYTAWKRKIESLSYMFRMDLRIILDNLEIDTFNPEVVFAVQKSEHPYIIKGYMSRQINLETLVVLNKLYKFTDKFDREIEETLVWPDISRLIRKYSPFLKIDKEKYHGIIRERLS
jgi:hypothetical protein